MLRHLKIDHDNRLQQEVGQSQAASHKPTCYLLKHMRRDALRCDVMLHQEAGLLVGIDKGFL